jgi:membrane-bound metal-dependent hydrolase YbcI (DUF457 family)
MMARQHVASGYAGYMTVVSTLGGTNPLWQNAPHVAWLEAAAQPISLILASVVAGAFAIWPDIDHPGSTVSKKLGIIGSILSPLVRIFAFGHRGVTHSWIFVALNGIGIFFLSQTLVGIFGDIAARILVGVLLALSALLITRLMLPGNAGKGNAGALVAAALVALVALHPDATDISWLPIAVAGGVFLHIVGDTITTGGTKFFLPFPVKIAVPLVGNTNSWIERLVAGPLFTFVNVVFTLLVVIIPIFPALGESMNTTVTSIQGVSISGVFLTAIIITAFDLVTRVIAGKPEFGSH